MLRSAQHDISGLSRIATQSQGGGRLSVGRIVKEWRREWQRAGSTSEGGFFSLVENPAGADRHGGLAVGAVNVRALAGAARWLSGYGIAGDGFDLAVATDAPRPVRQPPLTTNIPIKLIANAAMTGFLNTRLK